MSVGDICKACPRAIPCMSKIKWKTCQFEFPGENKMRKFHRKSHEFHKLKSFRLLLPCSQESSDPLWTHRSAYALTGCEQLFWWSQSVDCLHLFVWEARKLQLTKAPKFLPKKDRDMWTIPLSLHVVCSGCERAKTEFGYRLEFYQALQSGHNTRFW